MRVPARAMQVPEIVTLTVPAPMLRLALRVPARVTPMVSTWVTMRGSYQASYGP